MARLSVLDGARPNSTGVATSTFEGSVSRAAPGAADLRVVLERLDAREGAHGPSNADPLAGIVMVSPTYPVGTRHRP